MLQIKLYSYAGEFNSQERPFCLRSSHEPKHLFFFTLLLSLYIFIPARCMYTFNDKLTTNKSNTSFFIIRCDVKGSQHSPTIWTFYMILRNSNGIHCMWNFFLIILFGDMQQANAVVVCSKTISLVKFALETERGIVVYFPCERKNNTLDLLHFVDCATR